MIKINVGWGPIAQCNMNCAFCYSKFKRKSNIKNLAYDDWIKFIDENHQYINSINYGTGENTLSNDWFRLIYYIRSKYPSITQALTTNGHLFEAVKDEFCLNAFVYAIDEVDVSLDFADKKKHNAFRGQSNAYSWAIKTLELCKLYNKRLTIVFLGSRVNIYRENIDDLFHIAYNYNAILRMNIYRPTEGLNNHSRHFIVSYDQIKELLSHIYDHYHIIKINDPLFSSIFCNQPSNDPSGVNSIRILSDGSITPSTYLISDNYIIGNITTKNILSKLISNMSIRNVIKKILPDECKSCIYANTCCGGVYDRRFLWYGSLQHKDPYCPSSYNNNMKPFISMSSSSNSFDSVHDGYLPTMFFSN